MISFYRGRESNPEPIKFFKICSATKAALWITRLLSSPERPQEPKPEPKPKPERPKKFITEVVVDTKTAIFKNSHFYDKTVTTVKTP